MVPRNSRVLRYTCRAEVKTQVCASSIAGERRETKKERERERGREGERGRESTYVRTYSSVTDFFTSAGSIPGISVSNGAYICAQNGTSFMNYVPAINR